jgi:hypothetical protein
LRARTGGVGLGRDRHADRYSAQTRASCAATRPAVACLREVARLS